MPARKKVFELLKVISAQDWNDLVRETYGRPYDFLQQDCGGSYQPERGLFPVQLDEDEEDENGVPLTEWLAAKAPEKPFSFEEELHWEREFYPRLQELVRDMIAKGVLDPGDFYINVTC